jgi:hypothetical protein
MGLGQQSYKDMKRIELANDNIHRLLCEGDRQSDSLSMEFKK